MEYVMYRALQSAQGIPVNKSLSGLDTHQMTEHAPSGQCWLLPNTRFSDWETPLAPRLCPGVKSMVLLRTH